MFEGEMDRRVCTGSFLRFPLPILPGFPRLKNSDALRNRAGEHHADIVGHKGDVRSEEYEIFTKK